MKKNVVLFLTTPNSPSRAKLCLENFKQLEKLGCDIITLTTTDFLPDHIYENSKFVIHDYNEHKCTKKDYYNYYKDSGGYGYFFWQDNITHTVRLFHDTYFPSVIRHTRTLIHFAKSLLYENYFFVEDDHFFDDRDLIKIKKLFKNLDTHDLIVFSFKRDGLNQNSNECVYCSWFHFGKIEKSNLLFKNFCYTSDDFIKEPNVYLHFYEYIFKTLVYKYKTEDFKVLEITENAVDFFGNSNLNKIYAGRNISDDTRCNFIYDTRENKNIFYFKSNGLNQEVNIKFYIDDNLTYEYNIPPGNWYSIFIENEHINRTKVVFNDRIVKNFKNLKLDEIIYNGEII